MTRALSASPAALDTNVLVYAHDRQSAFFAGAGALLDAALRHPGLYAVTPQVLSEFFAVISDGRRVPNPATPAVAADAVIRLCRSRSLAKVYPKRGTIARAVRLAARLHRPGAALFDVILAQTLLDGGVRRIVTEDVADFGRIPGLTAKTIAQACAELPQ